jgi:hypothetical protein
MGRLSRRSAPDEAKEHQEKSPASGVPYPALTENLVLIFRGMPHFGPAVVVSVLTPAEVLIAARRLAGARPHLTAVAGLVQHGDLWQL